MPSKQDKRNTATQLRSNRAVEVAVNKKMYSGMNGVPKLVAIIPMSPSIDPSSVIASFNESLDISGAQAINNPGVTTVFSQKFRQKLTYVVPPRNFMSILDVAKAADFVMFLLSATEEVDEFGELCIRSIESQGVSTAVAVIPDIDSVEGVKAQSDVRGSLFSFFKHFFPATDKIYASQVASESLNVSRLLCQKFPKGVVWRDERPYLFADDLYWESDDSVEQRGYAVVEGFVRGRGFNPDRLVHLPGFGDFQVAKIVKAPSNSHHAMEVDGESNEILPTENKETLDELLPLDEEMVDDENGGHDKATYRLDGNGIYGEGDYDEDLEINTRRLPRGTSAYQSKWLIDDELIDDEELSEEEFDDDDMFDNNGEGDFGVSKPAPSEYDTMTEAGDLQSEMFVELSAQEEEKQLAEYRRKARYDREFPDEVELLPTESAKERMKRYRGLKNLSSCTWDVNEADPRAPEDWHRLLRVQNYRATRNKLLKDAIVNSAVDVGTRVKIYILANELIVNSIKTEQVAFTVYGLLEHEHKQGVVNYSIFQNTEYTESIAAKDTLIAQCGPRRFLVRPIFSQFGRSSNNVYKYERFLHPGQNSTASFIGPVTFGNLPVVYFKQTNEKLELVGTGSVLDADHTRILAKRAVLTGAPLKIHKKLVTIRYMFFNREDILHYKAVPLFTKTGKSGFIKEALGTHGYFKATFDRKISAQEVIAMALYKRIWPRTSVLWNGNM